MLFGLIRERGVSMDSILNLFTDTSNSAVTFTLLCLCVVRFYLQVIDFKFDQLPIGKVLAQAYGPDRFRSFHRYGFFLSLGYFILFAPGYFLQ